MESHWSIQPETWPGAARYGHLIYHPKKAVRKLIPSDALRLKFKKKLIAHICVYLSIGICVSKIQAANYISALNGIFLRILFSCWKFSSTDTIANKDNRTKTRCSWIVRVNGYNDSKRTPSRPFLIFVDATARTAILLWSHPGDSIQLNPRSLFKHHFSIKKSRLFDIEKI